MDDNDRQYNFEITSLLIRMREGGWVHCNDPIPGTNATVGEGLEVLSQWLRHMVQVCYECNKDRDWECSTCLSNKALTTREGKRLEAI